MRAKSWQVALYARDRADIEVGPLGRIASLALGGSLASAFLHGSLSLLFLRPAIELRLRLVKTISKVR
jgi:hypothetical protein